MGDIIKFGRVPFKIKESSLEKFYKNESMESLERNITDIDSEEGGQGINAHLKSIVASQINKMEVSPRHQDIPFMIHQHLVEHLESEAEFQN